MELKKVKEKEEEQADLLPLLQNCWTIGLQNWHWFLLSVIVCLGLGFLYLQSQPRVYQRQAVMLIEDSQGGSMNGSMPRSRTRSNMTSLMELNGVSVGDNLKNEIFILGSKRLMNIVVEKLNLDVDYTTDESLHYVSLYGKERPFEVLFQDSVARMAYSFKIQKTGASSVRLFDFKDQEGNTYPDMSLQLGQMKKTPLGTFCIVRAPKFDKWKEEIITVTRLPREKAATRFMSEIKASEYDKETSLIVISCNDVNRRRADDLLTTLYNTYKEDVVENKNRVALNTAKFIDERIALIGEELSKVENQLAGFKKQNQLIDFQQTASQVLGQTTKAHELSLQLETELNVARYLGTYIQNHSNDHDLIPALNIGDAGFNTQISRYNELMNQRNSMIANSSEQTTVVRELDRQLSQMRQSILASVKSYIQSIQLQLQDARLNERLLSGKISSAPEQEKQGLDIQRQQSLKEALYTYLLNKREEVALQQAINEANVRLVEGPIGDLKVSPRGTIIMAFALIIGLCIPSLILWIIYMFDTTVHNRKEIEEATTIPLLGEVPHIKNTDSTTLISELPSDDPVVEAFRIMRFNLGFIRQHPKVFVCTSTTPGQGKSFVSRNMGIILAMAKKKVIIIDADIRKRNLSSHFGHNSGLTTYLADEYSKLEEMIIPDGIAKGVDFMPAGSVPPNPSELLMSERLETLVEQLREQYDYIIFDSTPMFSVADANIVSRLVDTTLYVMRAGMQPRAFLPELERIYQSGRMKNLVLILNDVNFKKGRYNTGYGYGYGYGYGASYSYERSGNHTRRAKNLLSRLKPGKN